ncbi:MAG: hypothetical protein J0M08_12220 [Bacteroidetes bacterium]|nr:hypothetical protein [Bacteroidota bacterium]
MNTLKTILVLTNLTFLLLINSCKKDDDKVPNPEPPANESEVITTVKLSFIDSAGLVPSVEATFKDPDGDGGNIPTVFDTIKLKANTTYYASVILLDETKNPADTISNEVQEEAEDHLFCYYPSAISISILTTDVDANGYLVGLHSKWRVGSIGTGATQVILKHQPEIKNGSCSLGETDIDILFPTKIE